MTRTDRRPPRATGWSLAAAILTVLTACSSGSQPCPRPAALAAERDVSLPYRQLDDDTAAAAMPSLVVEVTSSEPDDERIRLSLDGDTALDVDVPGDGGCGSGHSAIFSLGYELPAGAVEAELTLQGETSSSTIVVPASGTVWAVIDVQSERAWGDIEVYDTEPMWG